MTPEEIRALAEAWPDPEAETAYWRRVCSEMVTHAAAEAYAAGREAGWTACMDALKRAQRGAVADLALYFRRGDGGARQTWAERMTRPGEFKGFGASYRARPYPGGSP